MLLWTLSLVLVAAASQEIPPAVVCPYSVSSYRFINTTVWREPNGKTGLAQDDIFNTNYTGYKWSEYEAACAQVGLGVANVTSAELLSLYDTSLLCYPPVNDETKMIQMYWARSVDGVPSPSCWAFGQRATLFSLPSLDICDFILVPVICQVAEGPAITTVTVDTTITQEAVHVLISYNTLSTTTTTEEVTLVLTATHTTTTRSHQTCRPRTAKAINNQWMLCPYNIENMYFFVNNTNPTSHVESAQAACAAIGMFPANVTFGGEYEAMILALAESCEVNAFWFGSLLQLAASAAVLTLNPSAYQFAWSDLEYYDMVISSWSSFIRWSLCQPGPNAISTEYTSTTGTETKTATSTETSVITTTITVPAQVELVITESSVTYTATIVTTTRTVNC